MYHIHPSSDEDEKPIGEGCHCITYCFTGLDHDTITSIQINYYVFVVQIQFQQ
jgi:hypothetical protein